LAFNPILGQVAIRPQAPDKQRSAMKFLVATDVVLA
jgi:hypothetical protein